MKKLKLSLELSLLFLIALFGALPVQAIPIIENVVVNPPPTDNWIVAPTTGAQGIDTVQVKFDVKVTGESCANFRFGVMRLGRCQRLAIPSNLVDSTSAISGNCFPPTPEKPSTTGWVKLFFDVKKSVNGDPLRLCAETAAGERALEVFKISFGQPVIAVNIPPGNAIFSPQKNRLRVQGNVVPKGQTSVIGSQVHLFDDAGNKIGTGLVNQQKAFVIVVDMSAPPVSVRAKVVNTQSALRPVKLVQ
jgi:hypothetical protein